MAFRFKQFQVEDDRSTMKVTTDAVLLGAWTDVDNTSLILDVGSGSGIIALMLAQRSRAIIDAVEIDADTCRQAAENFEKSPWADRLRMINKSFQELYKESSETYQLIVSNPPFFTNSLKSPFSNKNLSKHDTRLTFQEFLHGAARLISGKGHLAVILPGCENDLFISLSRPEGFHLLKRTQIIPVEGKPAKRVLLKFGRQRPTEVIATELTIRDLSGQYTPEYISLTEAFYLGL